MNKGHGERAHSRADPTAAEIREALGKVLSTEPFPGSERRSTLLRHLVEAAISGRAADLKEYAIGLAVFGKGPDYDPRVDPIVRVEIGRLRQKLTAYYETVGAQDPVRIELPKGGYLVSLVRSAAPLPRRSRAWLLWVPVAAGICGAAGFAGWMRHSKIQATVIYDSGFEAPIYHLGPLIGQDSWFTGVYGGDANITIRSHTVSTGRQAVQFAASGSKMWTRAFRAGKVNAAKAVSIFVDAQLSNTGAPSQWELISALGGGAAPRQLAVLGVRPTGELFLRQDGAGTTVNTGVFLTRGVWHHLELDINFAANNMDAHLNGKKIVSAFEFLNPPAGSLWKVGFEMSNGDIGTDTAYFDNFSVHVVP